MPVRFSRPIGACIGFSLALLAVVVPSVVLAAERMPVDTAEQWGLVGSWAVDCQRRPSNDNAYYSYVRQGDSLLVRRDLGVLQDENKVISAGITGDDRIELVTEFKAFSQVMTSLYARDNADQFHAVSNRDEKGAYTILDGKSARTGSATPVMTRCKKADN